MGSMLVMDNFTTYALDSETVGFVPNPKTGHVDIIELATIPLDHELQELKNLVASKSVAELIVHFTEAGTVQRYRPATEIHPKASAVHGIMFRDLLKCPKTADLELPGTMQYLLAHSASYDYRALGKPTHIKTICTMLLAKRLDKKYGIGYPNHKLDTLITYYYGESASFLVENSHEALNDTIKVILLLVKLLEYTPKLETFEELYTFAGALKGK